MKYIISYHGLPPWDRAAQTIEDARAIIRAECGKAEPQRNDAKAIELWNEADRACHRWDAIELWSVGHKTYAISANPLYRDLSTGFAH